MILYHGSSKKFDYIKKNQAQKGENLTVPENELLDAIYFTPDLHFAMAVASMPDNSAVHIDNENKKIEFEKPESFDAKKDIYIYEVDGDALPSEDFKYVDERQYAFVGKENVKPISVLHFKAEDIFKYYELTNWNKENSQEMKGESKLK